MWNYSLNKFQFIGNLTRDPEVQNTKNGNIVTKIDIAVNDSKKTSDDTYEADTHFFKLTIFKRTAELAREYLKKGMKIMAEGKIVPNSYEKDGEKKYVINFIVNNLLPLSKHGKKSDTDNNTTQTEPPFETPDDGSDSDDVPF